MKHERERLLEKIEQINTDIELLDKDEGKFTGYKDYQRETKLIKEVEIYDEPKGSYGEYIGKVIYSTPYWVYGYGENRAPIICYKGKPFFEYSNDTLSTDQTNDILTEEEMAKAIKVCIMADEMKKKSNEERERKRIEANKERDKK